MLVLLAVSSIQTALLGGATVPPPAPPLVLELHDLRGFAGVEPQDGLDMQIAPALSAVNPWGFWSEGRDTSRYMDVFRSLAIDELESEGRSSAMEDGLFRLRAPAAVHELAAGTFAFLGGVFGAEVELQIDSVLVQKGRPISAGAVGIEEADQLIAAAERRLGSWRTRVSSTHPALLTSTRLVPFVADYDVEIAQGAIAYDPILLPAELGTRIQVAAAPSPIGTWLALALGSSEALGDVRDIDVPLAALVGSGVEDATSGQPKSLGATKPRKVEGPRKLQALAVQDRSLVLNTFLPEGRALVVTTSLDVKTAHGTRALVLRRVGPALPIHAGFRPDEHGRNRFAGSAASTDGPEIFAIDLSAARPPFLHVEGPGDVGMEDIGLQEGPRIIAQIQRPDLDGAREEVFAASASILESSEFMELERIGNWALFVGRRGLGTLGIGQRGLGDPLVTMELLRPVPRLFQVTVTLSRRGEVGARCTLPVRADARSTVVLGTEDTLVHDATVEVAQFAMVADPVVRVEFEGLVVHVEPRVSRSGAVSLDVSALARLARGEPREFASGSEVLPDLRVSSLDRLVLQERLQFENGAGSQRLRLGDRSEPSEGLTLDFEIVELR